MQKVEEERLTRGERTHGHQKSPHILKREDLAFPMKLYVCYGTWKPAPRPGGHPCGNAYQALVDAGHAPEVVRSYGLGILPEMFNRSRGRRKVKELTGSQMVPALVTEDGEVVQGSQAIIAWARSHPAVPAAT